MDMRYSRNMARDEVREKVIPAYMGLIKQIDDQMGVLMQFLEASGVLDATDVATRKAASTGGAVLDAAVFVPLLGASALAFGAGALALTVLAVRDGVIGEVAGQASDLVIEVHTDRGREMLEVVFDGRLVRSLHAPEDLLPAANALAREIVIPKDRPIEIVLSSKRFP